MKASEKLANQHLLIDALRAQLEREHGAVQVYETHISWVLVAGGHAWKFKKALALGFLDHTRLAARHFHCLEELRLNRRLAPDLYLAVVPISGSVHEPVLYGQGAPIEYAVKMRAFEQSALWDVRLRENTLSAEEVEALALLLARFHREVPRATGETEWGRPDVLADIAAENFDTVARLAPPEQQEAVAALRAWDRTQRDALDPVFRKRKEKGFVRECHGDLHAGNILTLDGRVQVFDCIEFNARMRWIDVLNDLAFACMDLDYRGRPGLSMRLLNGYLSRTGDYAGLRVARYYLVQRALVRCKVALLRAGQSNGEAGAAQSRQAQQALAEAGRYLRLAQDHAAAPAPALVIMHGLSGSGKSTFAAQLAERAGLVWLRSDVERKRMHGLKANTRGGAELYAPAVSDAVYRGLATLAHEALLAAYPVVVDAAFLQRSQRDVLRAVAEQRGLRFVIAHMQADPDVLRERVAARALEGRDPSDADLAVLEQQLSGHEPLAPDEEALAVRIGQIGQQSWEAALEQLCRRLRQEKVSAGKPD